MAGLLKPYIAYELINRLKENIKVPIHMQCHATTGLSTVTALKAIEAGIDNIDTAISSMSMTYGHSPTETVVSMLENTARDTGLNIELLEEISVYFRKVRKKYAKFEGSLKGIDPRILLAQVPGGMLTNMESQLRENNALDRLDEVLKEIPRVREDLGFIPLVTPTSQIVGTQSVLNILTGERYKTITKEASGILKGEYGTTPAPVDAELQARVLEGSDPITCRPADNIAPEMDILESQFDEIVSEKNIVLAKDKIDDLLTYALFPQVGTLFLENRNNPDFFEPVPQGVSNTTVNEKNEGIYTVSFEGNSYTVSVSAGGSITSMIPPSNNQSQSPNASHIESKSSSSSDEEEVLAPLSGNIWKILVKPNQSLNEGDTLLILEAMKMETEIKAARSGIVTNINIKEGDSVTVGQVLLSLV
jgi:oxaloacetate decarboxylase alpha subunit